MTRTLFLFSVLIFAINAKATDDCKDSALAMSNFIADCTGYLEGRALSGGGDANANRIRARCKCAADRFSVERLANKKCVTDLSDIEIVMKMDKVKAACGK